ncbi:hypothetical protein VFPPC_15541 [Pochonia chlamydosporia 170]|uniref:Uncharacterized protein n=1 Tax=Pochonia chlamydosporia 170 TaxID=1380566 RepID=A0A179FWV8_METCM|nr:hypothetical protein VFPPC_15541 [Pochonia chlamydosporia 170]OAQ70145.1 hypothetical protein VFPPC_15541 [Pochonia chlamydosporia 170]
MMCQNRQHRVRYCYASGGLDGRTNTTSYFARIRYGMASSILKCCFLFHALNDTGQAPRNLELQYLISA